MAKVKNSFVNLLSEPTVNSIQGMGGSNQKKIEGEVERLIEISEGLVQRMYDMRKIFDSKKVKTLFENANTLNKFAKKIQGEQDKGTVKDVSDKKAVKIDKLENESSGEALPILQKILELLQKAYDNDKLTSEKKQNFEEERVMESDRKNKLFLDALKERKQKKETFEKVEEEGEDKSKSFLESIVEAFGGAKTALKLIGSVGKFFLTNPIGIALLGAASLGALFLAMKKASPEAHKEASNVQKAGDVSAEGKAITEAAENTSAIEKKKMNLLANRPSSKKSYLFWKDGDLQKKYLEEIGWDEKTGTTQEDRNNGIERIDSEGKPVMMKATPSADGGAGQTVPAGENAGAESAGGAGGATATPVSDSGATGATGAAGAAGSPGAPGESGDAIAGGSESATSEGTSTNIPSGISSTAESVSSGGSELGNKLNQITDQNMEMKLDEKAAAAAASLVTNNSDVTNISQDQTPSKSKLPPVRNQEETFQRMIFNNTRVV